MTDVKVDEDFYVIITELGDMALVEDEEEEFRQHMRHMIMEYFYDELGDRNDSNVVEKLRLKASRIAQESNFVNSITEVIVDNQEGDTLEMTIRYTPGEAFSFEVV